MFNVHCSMFNVFSIFAVSMLTKTEAIVLHSLKYGETRMIVDMFTKTHGRLSFMVNIPKTAHAKVKKQLFQPLTILEVEIDVRPKVQLQKLRDVRLATPFTTIPFHSHKLAISLFIAEFLYYARPSSTISPTAYSGSTARQTTLPISIWCSSCA